MVRDESAKTAKIMRLENLPLYSILFHSSEKIHDCLSNGASMSLHFEFELTSSLLYSSLLHSSLLLFIFCHIAGQSQMITARIYAHSFFALRAWLCASIKGIIMLEVRAAKLNL